MNTRFQRRLSLVLCVLSSLVVGDLKPPHGNQYVYMSHFYKQVFQNLAGDWYSSTHDTNIGFTLFLRILYKIFAFSNLEIFNFLNLALTLAINSASIYLLLEITKLLSKRILLRDYQIILVITCAIGFSHPDIKNGVAGLYFMQPMLQPSSFGVLFLSGIYYLILSIQQRDSIDINRRKSTFYFLSSIFFHPSLLASYLIINVSFFIIMVHQHKISRREIYILFRQILSALIIVVSMNPDVIKFYLDSERYQSALKYFAEYRIPYHVIPHVWMDRNEIFRIFLMLAGSLILLSNNRMSESWKFLVALASSIPVTAIFAEITHNTSFELSMPWRISAFIYPIVFICIVLEIIQRFQLTKFKYMQLLHIVAILAIFELLGMGRLGVVISFVMIGDWFLVHRRLDLAIRFTSVALIGCLAFGGFTATRSAYLNEESLVEDKFLSSEQLIGTGLVPPAAYDLGLRYGLAAFVTEQAAPVAGVDIIEWKRRILLARKIYKNFGTVCEYQEILKLNWIIVREDTPLPNCIIDRETIFGKQWKAVILH